MTTTRLNGVDLHHEVTGHGERVVLTHGSWTDATGWAPVVGALAERYEVVTWDRRGHSRSQAGAGPGSRSEDAADLATLIEHLGGTPVHVVGNSYGAIVALTVVTTRPDLVITAAAHEPPLFSLLEGTGERALTEMLATVYQRLGSVATLIEAGFHRNAAEHFVENVALGPGAWGRLPESFRAVLEANAPTYLDELRDPTALTIDATALAATTVPLLLTHGTESPALFPAVIAKLASLVPEAEVDVYAGAGHLPHATHPEDWTARLLAFHDQTRSTR
ncbi:MAG TPA: alpha/beta hydrolase [Acidimicrobiales bacterium]